MIVDFDEWQPKSDVNDLNDENMFEENKLNPLRTVVVYMYQGNKYFTVLKHSITLPTFILLI